MGRAQLKKEGKKKPHTVRAKELVPGVNRIGRSRSAHLTHRWKFIEKAKKTAADKKVRHQLEQWRRTSSSGQRREGEPGKGDGEWDAGLQPVAYARHGTVLRVAVVWWWWWWRASNRTRRLT